MKPAVLIVDMLKDTLEGAHPMPIKEMDRVIVPAAINRLTYFARGRSIPVIFSIDNFCLFHIELLFRHFNKRNILTPSTACIN